MKIKIPESSKVRIEIVPLIDVMFLVLASFVYATLSMAIHKGIVVKLPFSKVVEVQEQGKISVAIDENGIVYVEKTQVKLEELRKYLTENFKQEDQSVFLFADKNVRYQLLFDVLDQIKLAGFSKISLQAKRE